MIWPWARPGRPRTRVRSPPLAGSRERIEGTEDLVRGPRQERSLRSTLLASSGCRLALAAPRSPVAPIGTTVADLTTACAQLCRSMGSTGRSSTRGSIYQFERSYGHPGARHGIQPLTVCFGALIEGRLPSATTVEFCARRSAVVSPVEPRGHLGCPSSALRQFRRVTSTGMTTQGKLSARRASRPAPAPPRAAPGRRRRSARAWRSRPRCGSGRPCTARRSWPSA